MAGPQRPIGGEGPQRRQQQQPFSPSPLGERGAGRGRQQSPPPLPSIKRLGEQLARPGGLHNFVHGGHDLAGPAVKPGHHEAVLSHLAGLQGDGKFFNALHSLASAAALGHPFAREWAQRALLNRQPPGAAGATHGPAARERASVVNLSALPPGERAHAESLLSAFPKLKGTEHPLAPAGFNFKGLLGEGVSHRPVMEHDLQPAKPFAGQPGAVPFQQTQTPLPKAIGKHLREEETRTLKAHHAKRLAEIFNALPPDKEFEQAALAGEAKRGWYENASKSLKAMFGKDTPRFVALLAGTSPRQPVRQNLRMAAKIWSAWHAAGRPTDTVEKQVPVVDEGTGQPRLDEAGKPLTKTIRTMPFLGDIPGAEMGSRLPNTLAALTGEEEGLSLSGDKVESFRRNLMGDLDASTNDVWMANFADVDQKLFGSRLGYKAFTAKVRRVADKLGWKPAEVQETIWSFFRSLAGLRHAGLSRQEALERITHEHVGQTEDFTTLMLEDEDVKRELAAAGIRPRRPRGGPGRGAGGHGGTPQEPAPALAGRIEGGDPRILERLARRAGKFASSFGERPDLSKLTPKQYQAAVEELFFEHFGFRPDPEQLAFLCADLPGQLDLSAHDSDAKELAQGDVILGDSP